jgi:hypothetical protein
MTLLRFVGNIFADLGQLMRRKVPETCGWILGIICLIGSMLLIAPCLGLLPGIILAATISLVMGIMFYFITGIILELIIPSLRQWLRRLSKNIRWRWREASNKGGDHGCPESRRGPADAGRE